MYKSNMLSQFLIDNEIYLSFLEIKEQDIPIKNDTINKNVFFKLVENQFRVLARKYHPDYGGNDEDFKLLLKSKSKLIEEDQSDKEFSLKIDFNRFEAFDKKSLAGILGNQLFDQICEWSQDLNLKPIFKPTTSEHEYEWIFKILDTEDQLSLNVQNLNHELAEISNNLYKECSLSVLVCLFVPSKQMVAIEYKYDNSISLSFNDKILIESSSSKDIENYFKTKDEIANDLIKIKNNTLEKRKGSEIKTRKSSEVKEKDKKIIELLNNFKIFNTEYDEHAADFLKNLKLPDDI